MKVKLNLFLSVLLVTILIFSTMYSTYAVTQQELNDLKNQINETEQEINQVKDNLSQEMKKIGELDADIEEVEYNLEKIQKELRDLQKEINELEEKLEKKIAEYDEKYEIACKRMITHHKYGNITYLDVLLNSRSLTDFLSSYYVVNEILEVDEQLLDELEKEKEQIENDKTALETKKTEVEERKKQVESQKIVLTNKKNDRQKIVSNLKEEEKELRKQIEKERAEYANKEEEWKRLAAQANGGGSYSGGKLQFPCPGYSRISSYFGSRGSPLTGGSSYHKGIDMAAPKGTSILAGESGTVIAVYTGCTHNYGKSRSCGCGSGFGNYVMVNHGGGLVTVYAHCTSINVSLNSKVSRGQVIATVGSTGASTGNHLHFGTLSNGTYVNPAPYIGL